MYMSLLWRPLLAEEIRRPNRPRRASLPPQVRVTAKDASSERPFGVFYAQEAVAVSANRHRPSLLLRQSDAGNRASESPQPPPSEALRPTSLDEREPDGSRLQDQIHSPFGYFSPQ